MPKKNKKTITEEVVVAADTTVPAVETPVDEVKAPSSNHLIIDDTPNANSHWYVVHTYSGYENKTSQTLKQKVESLGLQQFIKEVLVPTQEKIKINKGKRSTIKEKIFPGYILIKMEVTDDSWLAVRTTTGVTGFVGTGNKPTRLPDSEVEVIKEFVSQKAPKFTSTFSQGDTVKITEGPFADFLGSVTKIDEAKGKVHVLVSFFGRETPVELDFLQVSKI